MGCWSSKSTNEDNGPASNAPKVYSWDKRDRINPSDYIIEQVHSGETGRLPNTINGEQIIIRDCSNCCIYLLDHINTITVDDCKKCTLIIGPTAGSIFLRECVECTVVVACGQFRTRDCRQLDVRLLCNTQPIIEASNRIKMSCYQLYYPELKGQFEKARLSVFNNNWADVHDFTPKDGEKNWSVSLPDALEDIKKPSSDYFENISLSLERHESLVPFTLGSLNSSPHRSLNDEPLLVLVYCSTLQHHTVTSIINSLHHSAGMGSVLFTQEARVKQDDISRVFGDMGDNGAKLLKGPVVGVLVDAPYDAITQAVDGLNEDLIYVAPNNGNGFSQTNRFFSLVNSNISF